MPTILSALSVRFGRTLPLRFSWVAVGRRWSMRIPGSVAVVFSRLLGDAEITRRALFVSVRGALSKNGREKLHPAAAAGVTLKNTPFLVVVYRDTYGLLPALTVLRIAIPPRGMPESISRFNLQYGIYYALGHAAEMQRSALEEAE